jgi:hypothetical protein
VKARAARKRAQEDYPSATGGDALTVSVPPAAETVSRHVPELVPPESDAAGGSR